MRGLVPNALWWFRWGAMFTFLTVGIILAVLMFHGHEPLTSARMTSILTGGAMGTIMWANVWFVIWPIQKIAIASAEKVAGGGEADPQAAARAPTAARASRTNTLFSFPMLFMMGSASHFSGAVGALGVYWVVALVLILAVEVNALMSSSPGHKPLSSVSGTIHAGLLLTLVLYIVRTVL